MGTLDTGLNSYHYGFIALFHHQTFTMRGNSGIILIFLFCSKGIWQPSTTVPVCVSSVSWSGQGAGGPVSAIISELVNTMCSDPPSSLQRCSDIRMGNCEQHPPFLPSASHDLPVPSAIITWIVFCSFLDIFEKDWAIFKSVELHKTDVGPE